MPKQKIKGFMSVELVIVAGIILFTGIAGIATMGSMGSSTVKSGLNKLDLLGIFSDEVQNGVDNEVPVENNDPVVGYPEGLIITPDMINPESDFVFEWDDALNGWNIKAYINDTDKDVVIPIGKEGEPVVRIGDNAFANKGLTSVVIPDTVITIGANAFLNNNLTSTINPDLLGFRKSKTVNGIILTNAAESEPVSFALPKDLISIGDSAFKNNKLTFIELPSGLKTISNSAFENNQLVEIEMPNSLITLGNYAFKGNQLTAITFLSSVPSNRGKGIFEGNPSLTDNTVLVPSMDFGAYRTAASSLGLSSSYIYINPLDVSPDDDFAFTWDSSLNGWSITNYVNLTRKDVVIPNKRVDGSPIVSIGINAFKDKQLTSAVLPSGIISIGQAAFENNLLKYINITSGVKTIGAGAFRNNKLELVDFLGPLPTSLPLSGSGSVFYNNNTLLAASITVPSASLSAYIGAVANLGVAQDRITVSDDDPNVENGMVYQWNTAYGGGWEAFLYKDRTTTNLTIPATRLDGKPIVSIAANTFKNVGLTSLTLPEGLKEIKGYAFSGNALTTLVIPNTVTTILQNAFEYNQLKEVVIGTGVTRIGGSAFANNKLTLVTLLGAKPTTLNENIFGNNPTLLPKSVYVYSQYYRDYSSTYQFALANADRITVNPSDPNLENGLAYIWSAEYNGWEVVTWVEKSETNIEIPSTRLDGTPIVAIGANALRAGGFTSVTLNEGLKAIKTYAFENNPITTLEIPSSVIEIGTYAFSKNALTSVKFLGVKPTKLPTGSTTGVFYLTQTLLAGSVQVPASQLTNYQGSASGFSLTSDKFVGY